ncbi:MAG: RluA family pseudouridine synthase [Fibrobacteria bacterium]|nr:RluA family pseudouridine synthase [Fibrobacteria bacterium]
MNIVTETAGIATEFQVAEGDAGQRLDRYLRKVLPSVPLSHIFQLVRKGRVRIDGARAEGSSRLPAGATITLGVRPGELQTAAPARPGASSLRDKVGILHEDDSLLILDKPAGMAVHPGTGTPPGTTLIERVWADLGDNPSVFQPALAHRLDRGTSGIVVVARTRPALLEVQDRLRDGSVIKEYLALVEGIPRKGSGVIRSKLERVDSRSGGAKSLVDERGVEAETRWKILETFASHALLEVRILTGRMHQIRAHLASIGHPIVGDDRYGQAAHPGLKRPFLHAAHLSLPFRGRVLDLRAPLPPELEGVLQRISGGTR